MRKRRVGEEQKEREELNSGKGREGGNESKVAEERKD